MRTIRFDRQAELDEVAIAIALSDRSGALGERFLDSVESTLQQVARTPGLGQLFETVQPRLAGIRVVRVDGFPNHLVFYRFDDSFLDVLRIVHGARELQGLWE